MSAALAAIPGYIDQWKSIPEEFWQEDIGGVVVCCPCGAEPLIPLHPPIRSCEGCNRVYIRTSARVLVSYGEPDNEAASGEASLTGEQTG